MTTDQLIEYLNALIRKEPEGLRTLLSTRAVVGPELAADPTVEATLQAASGMVTPRGARTAHRVTVLALLAGVATAAEQLQHQALPAEDRPPAPAPVRFVLRDDNGIAVIGRA